MKQIIQELEVLIDQYLEDERLFINEYGLEDKRGKEVHLEPVQSIEACSAEIEYLEDNDLDYYAYFNWLKVYRELLLQKVLQKNKYEQIVLVEFHNCSPFIYLVKSNKPITIEKVWKYFENTEGVHEDRDSITFLDDLTTIILNKKDER